MRLVFQSGVVQSVLNVVRRRVLVVLGDFDVYLYLNFTQKCAIKMTTETDTKSTEQKEENKEVAKEEVKKEEEAAKNAEEKSDDKAENADKEKDEDKKDEKVKKETPAVPKPAVHKVDYEKDVIYLYQFTRTPVLPSLSPYCLKVETWLRLAGLKYENVDHRMKYKSKKGQLPFIEVNGEEIADSAIIIKELGQRYNTDLDTGLTAEQRNVAHANISMIENHFAWVVKFWRTKNPATMLSGYKMDLQHITDKKWPKPVLEFIFKIKFKRAAKKVRAHGIGVHKPEEIEEFGHNDIKVLSDLLGEKEFFFGESPTTMDVVAFANLAQVVFMDKEVPYSLRDWMLENCNNLVSFCERMKERAFPDWDEMCANLDLNSHLPKPPPKEEEEKKKDEEEEEKKEDKKEEGEKEKEDKKDEKDKDDSEKEKTEKEEKEEEDNKKAEEKEEKK